MVFQYVDHWFIIFQLDTAIRFSEKLLVREYPNNFLSTILLSVKFYSVNSSTGLHEISIINFVNYNRLYDFRYFTPSIDDLLTICLVFNETLRTTDYTR